MSQTPKLVMMKKLMLLNKIVNTDGFLVRVPIKLTSKNAAYTTIGKLKIWRGQTTKNIAKQYKTIRKPKIRRGQTIEINQKHYKTIGNHKKT